MSRPNKKARRILGRVLRWLEAGAPHVVPRGGRAVDGFDMAYGVENGEKCGTVCCIAGAVCQFENLGTLSSAGDLEYFGYAGPLAREALGIPADEARLLFMPFDNYDVSSKDLTPEVAARTLRLYMKTGQILWLQEDGSEFPAAQE